MARIFGHIPMELSEKYGLIFGLPLTLHNSSITY